MTTTHRVTIKQIEDVEFETRNSSQAWSVHCSCGELDELRTSEDRALRSKAEHLAEVKAVDEPEEEAEPEPAPAKDSHVQKSNVPPPPSAPSADPRQQSKPAEKGKP